MKNILVIKNEINNKLISLINLLFYTSFKTITTTKPRTRMNHTIEVINNNGTLCYKVNGGKIKYHHRFPMDWAINHVSPIPEWKDFSTGPEFCGNCEYHGSIGDVFIGYCADCGAHCHGLKRGVGMNNGRELSFHELLEMLPLSKEDFDSCSIYKTYMKGVDINELIERHTVQECINDIRTSLQSREVFPEEEQLKNMTDVEKIIFMAKGLLGHK